MKRRTGPGAPRPLEGPTTARRALRFTVVLTCLAAAATAGSSATSLRIVEVETGLETYDIELGDRVVGVGAVGRAPESPSSPARFLSSIATWSSTGPVSLHLERNGRRHVVDVPAGRWSLTVAPDPTPQQATAFAAGVERLKAGDVEGAIERWRALVPRGERKIGQRRDSLSGWIEIRIVRAWREAGKLEPARAAGLSALQWVTDPETRAWLLSELVAVLRAESRFDEARESLREASALFAGLWGEDGPMVLQSRIQLASLDLESGELDKAAQQLVSVREDLEATSARGGYVAVDLLNQEGILAYSRGDPEGAAAAWNRALDLEAKIHSEGAMVARLANNLGAIAFALGDLDAAEKAFSRALEFHRRRSPGSADVAGSLSNLGAIAWRRGQLDVAWERWRRTLELEQAIEPDGLGAATAYNNLGLLLIELDDLDRAESHLERAGQIYRRLADGSLDLAMVSNNLVPLAFRHGDLDAARRYAEEAHRIQEAKAPGSPSLALTEVQLSEVALVQGRLEDARGHLERGLAIQGRLAPGSLSHAHALRNLGRLRVEQGEVDAALQAFDRALEIERRLASDSLGLAWTYRNRGLAWQGAGDSERAVEDFDAAVRTFEGQSGRLTVPYLMLANYRGNHLYFYRESRNQRIDLGQFDEAFTVEERSRARGFLELLAARGGAIEALGPEKRAEHEDLSLRYDRAFERFFSIGEGEPETQAALRADLDDLRGRLREIEVEAAHAFDSGTHSGAFEPLTAGEIARALAPGTLFLTYAVESDRTFVFVVRRDQPTDLREIGVGSEELASAVRRLRSLIIEVPPESALARRRRGAFDAAASALYDLLLRPVDDLLGGSQRLLVAMDGPLHFLPWPALRRVTGDSSMYLVEWLPVHLVSSGSVYAKLRQAERMASEGTALVGFGDPLYRAAADPARRLLPDVDPGTGQSNEHGQAFEPLPHTRAEVEEIARLFGDRATVLLGSEATEERFYAVAPEATILHLAAHGFTDAESPLDSAVVLSRPELLPAIDHPRENGLVQAWEILTQLRLRADLVVLSTCESGLGQTYSGEGLIGLTRAMHVAGARSVVASGWRVSDASTRRLMNDFYRRLLAGETKDQALRQAQLERLAAPWPESSPFHWAAFQLYGDWR